VIIPKRLLPRALRRITVRANRRNSQERIFHLRRRSDLLSINYRKLTEIW
jgi:hypothetical protein